MIGGFMNFLKISTFDDFGRVSGAFENPFPTQNDQNDDFSKIEQ